MTPRTGLFARSVVLAAALALAACGGRSEAPASQPDPVVSDTASVSPAPAPSPNPFEEPARRALRIETRLDHYQTVPGSWTVGDATSAFTAYFDGDALVLIEEQRSTGDDGAAHSAYYFASGDPFYIVQDERRARLDPDAATQRDTVQTRVAFAPSGAVAAAVQSVNGEARDAPGVEIEEIWSRAQPLATQARGTVL